MERARRGAGDRSGGQGCGSWLQKTAWAMLLWMPIACSGPAARPKLAVQKSSAPGAIELLERQAQMESSRSTRWQPRLTAPKMIEDERGTWRACGDASYGFEPASGGPYALTVRGREDVLKVMDAEALSRGGHDPERVRIHYVVVGRLVLAEEGTSGADACAGKNVMKAAVVGALRVEAETGVDLNEPRGSEQPHVRAAQLMTVGQPQRCLQLGARVPGRACLVPLAVGLRRPDAAGARGLARVLAAGGWPGS